MVVRCFWIDSEKRQQYQAGRHEVPQTIPFHGKRKKNKISLFIACYIYMHYGRWERLQLM